MKLMLKMQQMKNRECQKYKDSMLYHSPRFQPWGMLKYEIQIFNSFGFL